jgi:hypothetical protein
MIPGHQAPPALLQPAAGITRGESNTETRKKILYFISYNIEIVPTTKHWNLAASLLAAARMLLTS